MLKVIGLHQPDGFLSATMIVYRDRKPFHIDSEVASLVETGRANHLQRIHDDSDEFLGPALTVGIAGVPNGVRITLNSELGEHHAAVHQMGIIEDAGDSFANDIERNREATAVAINSEDMPQMARYYRAYLSACISTIDYFLYRYEANKKESGATIQKASGRMEDRIASWIAEYCPGRIDAISSASEYHAMGEIAKARNAVVHPKRPMLTYEAHEVVRILNLCGEGIGGFLRLLRISQSRSPYIGFISQIKTLRKLQKT
jgi:hypothetical protein